MAIKHLINDIYQVVDDHEHVLLQGTHDECLKYTMQEVLDKIVNTPELLNVFKQLADK
jgi:hypothetical protein